MKGSRKTLRAKVNEKNLTQRKKHKLSRKKEREMRDKQEALRRKLAGDKWSS